MPLPDGGRPEGASAPAPDEQPRPRTLWYTAGLVAQCVLWLLVLLALALAVLGGEGLTDFPLCRLLSGGPAAGGCRPTPCWRPSSPWAPGGRRRRC